MKEVGAVALALHAESLKRHGRRLYIEICLGKYSIVLLSPEQLSLPEIDEILRDEQLLKNLSLLSIDELHILYTWGKYFRKAYHQIGPLRRRLPSHVAVLGMTGMVSSLTISARH